MFIEKVNSENYSRFRIPGIVITEQGTLIAYYECRKTDWDWAEIDIKVIRSTDFGETWQTVTVIKGNGDTLNNPVMIVKGKEIHFLYLKNYKELFHCISTDDGKTFSVPVQRKLESNRFYNAVAIGPGHGIVHNGIMIVPVWLAQNKEDPKAHHPSVIGTLYSENGEIWKMGDIIGENILIDPSESALAVTLDNKVLISIRNENKGNERAFALSDNGIDNWGDVYFNPQMPDPVCMGSMCYENGTVYHINCNSKTGRENLTVKISTDCFKSFESVFVDMPAGYSDIAVKNRNLYIFYERDCISGGLYFKKIKL